ncbi:MAG: efflux RND transporter periplasmic adaptor subunit [Steroidobacteraceae bacterium]
MMAMILAPVVPLVHPGWGGQVAWAAAGGGAAPPAAKASADTVTLSDSQLNSIAVAAVALREFPIEKQAVGNIDFNEDMSVQVFTPYQGRIIRAFPNVGDDVKKSQVLFTLESPDFIAAESTLISTAAALDQTSSALTRARTLYASKAIDQNDYETAVANQASAEGALHAARHAVAIFGKSEAEIDHIVATRQVETALVVKSPIAGRITARNAAPGLLVQPGNAPAPYSVADLSTVWMLADVPESEIPSFKVGQKVSVSVGAFPGREFSGAITVIGATVDPNSRRVTLRSVIKDPKHELLPNMFASFVIRTAAPALAPAVPLNGVVREGDGTMSVWVVGSDPHRFTRRSVKIGEQRDGYDQILDGLKSGERVAVDGAIFLSNILYGGAS